MIDDFIAILEENTPLVKDSDLFYLEMPTGKSGLWFSDRQKDSVFNGTGDKDFDVYYRGKNKSKTMANIEALKDFIDVMPLSTCKLEDGTAFRMKVLYQWEYVGKDTEGYYVFANVINLLV